MRIRERGKLPFHALAACLDVEAEVDHVAVLHHVFLAFLTQLAGFLGGHFAAAAIGQLKSLPGAFIGGLGMPRSLGAVKIGAEHFDRIAKQAMGTPWVPRNPRPIPTPAEVREILELAA